MSMIHFGTDGWRGMIAKEFTFENVRKLSQAVADHLSRGSPKKGSLFIGYDRRFLSESFAEAASEVLAGNGFKVILFSKPVPTPLVSFNVVRKKALGGIVLTASHNPPEFHGFKFKEPWGGSATLETTGEIEKCLGCSKVRLMRFPEALHRKKIVLATPDRSYLACLWKKIDRSLLKKVKLRVLADALFGSAAEYLPRALSLGSVKVEVLHPERDVLFGGVQPEPFPESLGDLMKRMKRGTYDIGIALDGDGDRMAAVMPGGRFLPPTKILSLLLFHLTEAKGLRGKVVKTISGSHLIDRIADSYGLPLEETPVGFKHIAKVMSEDPEFLIGGEESGGMGFRGHIPERDGILSALFLLETMAIRRKSIAQLLQILKKRFGSYETARIDLSYPKQNWDSLARLARKKAKHLLGEIPSTLKDFDGLKLIGEKRWLLFRMSGTEPVLRIYAEAGSHQEVHRLLQRGKALALSGDLQ